MAGIMGDVNGSCGRRASAYPLDELRPGTVLRWHALKHVLRSWLRPGQRILDLGGYDGLMSFHLQSWLGISPIVFDTDDAALARAHVAGLSAVRGSGTCLPLADASIDVVLCLDVIEHVADPALLMGEVTRVLRRGGLLVLTTPVFGQRIYFLDDEQMLQLHQRWGHAKPGYTMGELRALMSDRGFTELSAARYFNAVSKLAYYLLFIRHVGRLPQWRRIQLWDLITRSLEPHLQVDSLCHILLAAKRNASVPTP